LGQEIEEISRGDLANMELFFIGRCGRDHCFNIPRRMRCAESVYIYAVWIYLFLFIL